MATRNRKYLHLAPQCRSPSRGDVDSMLLIGVTLVFLAFFLLVPLVAVFVQAFEKGWRVYFDSLYQVRRPGRHSLDLFVAAIVVPINTIFGVAAAWAISKFEFVGKSLLITLDRSALQRFAGDCRIDLRALVRTSRLVRAVARSTQHPVDLFRCPASFWPRCSSPFPSSPGS